MDKRQQALLFLLIAAGAFSGCKDQKQNAPEKEGVETVLPAQVNEVTVMTLKKNLTK